jgi:glycosyltransferase involved in cell wall biosynthesis
MSEITVVIPTVEKRSDLLGRAILSVVKQTLQPAGIIVVIDSTRAGAAEMRTRGLEMVTTEWVAFLDDDDTFNPEHLQRLMETAEATGADFVFPWFDVMGGTDPFPTNEHREFDVEAPHQTTVTTLVRTKAALAVGGFRWDEGIYGDDPGIDAEGHRSGEEFRFVIRLARAGYKIVHLDERTWTWFHHQRNSMGMPSRI